MTPSELDEGVAVARRPLREADADHEFTAATFTSLNVIIDVLPEARTGSGAALTRTLGQIGASFGVAILGSILNGVYRSELTGQLTTLPDQLAHLAEGTVAGAASRKRLRSSAMCQTAPRGAW